MAWSSQLQIAQQETLLPLLYISDLVCHLLSDLLHFLSGFHHTTHLLPAMMLFLDNNKAISLFACNWGCKLFFRYLISKRSLAFFDRREGIAKWECSKKNSPTLPMTSCHPSLTAYFESNFIMTHNFSSHTIKNKERFRKVINVWPR